METLVCVIANCITMFDATAIVLLLVLCNVIGILFRKDAGQHILKNPLVINGIIEKVPNITQPVGNIFGV